MLANNTLEEAKTKPDIIYRKTVQFGKISNFCAKRAIWIRDILVSVIITTWYIVSCVRLITRPAKNKNGQC